jgi:hypothetical protein
LKLEYYLLFVARRDLRYIGTDITITYIFLVKPSRSGPELQARKVKSIDWKRHENNIYDRIVEWFDVIG